MLLERLRSRVRTTGRTVVCCHTTARWLYSEAPAYLAGWLRASPARRRPCPGTAGPTAGADRVLTNSTVGAEQIRAAYGVVAQVLPPPPGLPQGGEQRRVEGVEPGFVLSVARLLAYKNVGVPVAAMVRLPGARLVVAGDGPERARLEAIAGAEVTLMGEVDDAEQRWMYANCAGVASAAYEDYGLTPLKAAAYASLPPCGAPAGSSTPSSKAGPECSSMSPARRRRSEGPQAEIWRPLPTTRTHSAQRLSAPTCERGLAHKAVVVTTRLAR